MSLLTKAALLATGRRRASAGGGAWSPSDLSPEWWLRGDLGITQSSGVSLWANQGTAGSTGDVTFSSGYRPTYESSNADFNSQATVNFASAGSGDVGYTGDDWWEGTTSSDDYVWVFVLQGTAAGSFDLFSTEDFAATSGAGGWEVQPLFATAETDPASSAQYVAVYGNNEPISEIYNQLGAAMRVGTVHVLAIVLSATSGTATLDVYIDGSKVYDADSESQALDVVQHVTSGKALFLGGTSATAGNLDAEIAECLMLKGSLSTGASSDDENLTAYLNTRYGLSLETVVGGSWTPRELGACAWYRADRGHSAADAGSVSSWANQGLEASAADLTQGTGSAQPTYDASHASFNGQATLSFDGGDTIDSSTGTWWESAATGSDFCIIGVHRPTNASGLDTLAMIDNWFNTGGWRLAPRVGAGSQFGADDGSSQNVETGAACSQNTLVIQAGVYIGGATDSMELFADGVGSTPSTPTLGIIDAGGSYAMLVGASQYEGDLAELIYIKRQLTADEDGFLSDYFDARYGTTTTAVTQ